MNVRMCYGLWSCARFRRLATLTTSWRERDDDDGDDDAATWDNSPTYSAQPQTSRLSSVRRDIHKNRHQQQLARYVCCNIARVQSVPNLVTSHRINRRLRGANNLRGAKWCCRSFVRLCSQPQRKVP